MLPVLHHGGIHANQPSPSSRRIRGSFVKPQMETADSLGYYSPGLGLKKMTEWFSNWLPWQQKILLCGITERCSKSQLELLVSTLEPVFHRDFVATLSQRYPSAGIRRMYERREARRAAALVYNSEESMQGSRVSFEDPAMNCLPPEELEFVERLTKNIFDEALEEVRIREEARRPPDVLTPNERADIDALSPSRVFGIMTPPSLSSTDSPTRRPAMSGMSGAFRNSAAGVPHQHHVGIPARLSPNDLRFDDSPTDDKQDEKKRRRFAGQLESIWKWLAAWPEQEKVRVVAELVKLCDKTEVHYLAQCLLQRLRAQVDVNSLPDKLLYKIFCLLPTRDLRSVAQVCRRWHYLASRDELWMFKSFELGRRLGVPNVVSLVKRKFRRQTAGIDWRFAYRELSAIGRQARDAIPLPVRVKSPTRSNEAQTGRKSTTRRYNRRAGSRAMSINSTTSRGSSFFTAFRHQVSRKSHSRSGRSSRASSTISEMEEFVDRRPLMKPILGKLKRFQDQEDVALDVRPHLKQMNDVLGLSEAKETLCWKHDLERTGQRGTFVTEVQPINQCRRLQGHLDAILCLQYDERRLITGSMDRSIRIWDVRSGRSIRKLYGHKGGIGCLHLWCNTLVSGSWDMTMMFWSLEPSFERLAVLSGHTNTVTGVRLMSGFMISASLDGTIRIYSTSTYKVQSVIDLLEPIQCLHCDKTQLITGHTDRLIRVTRFPSGEPLMELKGHTDQILALVVSGRLLISAGQLGYIRFWDLKMGTCEAGVDSQPPAATERVAVHSLGYFRGNFWSGHADGSVREWNLATMTCVRTLVGHKGTVRGLQVSARRVVTASDDGSSRIWEFPRSTPPAEGTDMHPPGQQLRRTAAQGELIKPRVLLQPAPVRQ